MRTTDAALCQKPVPPPASSTPAAIRTAPEPAAPHPNRSVPVVMPYMGCVRSTATRPSRLRTRRRPRRASRRGRRGRQSQHHREDRQHRAEHEERPKVRSAQVQTVVLPWLVRVRSPGLRRQVLARAGSGLACRHLGAAFGQPELLCNEEHVIHRSRSFRGGALANRGGARPGGQPPDFSTITAEFTSYRSRAPSAPAGGPAARRLAPPAAWRPFRARRRTLPRGISGGPVLMSPPSIRSSTVRPAASRLKRHSTIGTGRCSAPAVAQSVEARPLDP